MPYLHQSVCLSPQHSYPVADLSVVSASENNLLHVIEPDYPGIPAGIKRRMGKNVRMAVGAALPLLQKRQPDGIVIATANGGMEDCIKFLNQIIEYNEGLLTPASFVQSTSNAAAAQIALVSKNHHYNVTHVHRGLAFENALLDVIMLLKEKKNSEILLGCTDEISAYNYNIERLAGWYRTEDVFNQELFSRTARGTIAGEGSFMVLVNNEAESATAELRAVKTIHTKDMSLVLAMLKNFLKDHLSGELPDVLITGENGDERLTPSYEQVEDFLGDAVSVARFKHLCGEYCTASSFACWLAIQMFQQGNVPDITLKRNSTANSLRNILIYNNYRNEQHAFILLLAVDDVK